ncbi:MAG: thiol:disulfide interchange protein DsbA/DsbL [Gammaproteobacteria bacterium]|nr:thiol:disulfide interchange protein DsbA/DsbL [Gammaproteobacteria bacterium]
MNCKRYITLIAISSSLFSLFHAAQAFSTSPSTSNPSVEPQKIELLFNRDYGAAPDTARNNKNVTEYYQQNKLCSQPSVIEFFSYGCGGCYGADKNFQDWAKTKPSDVQFKRIPVNFHPGWDNLAKLYYTNEQFKINEDLHTKIFEWYQSEVQRTRSPVVSANQIENFISNELKNNPTLAKKVTLDKYMNVFNSTGLDAKVNNGMRIFASYGLTSTPSVAVNNQYTITVNQAGSLDKMMFTITELAKGKTICSLSA